MALRDVLRHTAVPYGKTETGAWVEGEFVPTDDTPRTAFRCALFLPVPGSESTTPPYPTGRRIVQPTLLYEPRDTAGGMVALSAEDELGVVAKELNVAQGRAATTEVRWQVLGDPQPFGRPGSPVVGFQATLQRVAE